jgi:DNA polymerase III subunit beta
LLSSTSYAMAVADVRYFLLGTLFQIENGRVVMCATDGHRLAVDSEVSNTEIKLDLIIPRRAVLLLEKIAKNGDGLIEIVIRANNVTFNFPDVTLTTKLIDGRFPNYQLVIPKNLDKITNVPRDELLGVLSRAKVFYNDKIKGGKFLFSNDTLLVRVENSDNGNSSDEIEAPYLYEPMEIGINIDYLTDALKSIPDEHITIELFNSESALLITPHGGGTCQHIIMPMRS